jgi:hypothetical protein
MDQTEGGGLSGARVSCEEEELALGNVQIYTFEGGSGSRIDLGDVEKFDHGIWGKGKPIPSGVMKLLTPKLSVKAAFYESGCQEDRFPSRAGIGFAGSSDVEGRAVIGGGPNEREAQGHIHSCTKRYTLEGCHTHVVVGSHHCIQLSLEGTMKDCVRRKWTLNQQSFRPELGHCRVE